MASLEAARCNSDSPTPLNEWNSLSTSENRQGHLHTHIIIDSRYPPNQPTYTLFYRESEMMWSAQMRRQQRLASGSSLHTMGTSLLLLVEHLATQPDHPQVEHTTREREMTSGGEKVTYCCGFKMSVNITFC